MDSRSKTELIERIVGREDADWRYGDEASTLHIMRRAEHISVQIASPGDGFKALSTGTNRRICTLSRGKPQHRK